MQQSCFFDRKRRKVRNMTAGSVILLPEEIKNEWKDVILLPEEIKTSGKMMLDMILVPIVPAM